MHFWTRSTSRGGGSKSRPSPAHVRERRIHAPSRGAEAGRTLASRHVELAHAARRRLLRKVGLAVTAYPVDFRTSWPEDATRGFPFVAEGLKRLDIATKEWAGLAAYRLAGHIDSLLPKPDIRPGSGVSPERHRRCRAGQSDRRPGNRPDRPAGPCGRSRSGPASSNGSQPAGSAASADPSRPDGRPRARARCRSDRASCPVPRSARDSIAASISSGEAVGRLITDHSCFKRADRASEANWRRHITYSTAPVVAMNTYALANQPR